MTWIEIGMNSSVSLTSEDFLTIICLISAVVVSVWKSFTPSFPFTLLHRKTKLTKLGKRDQNGRWGSWTPYQKAILCTLRYFNLSFLVFFCKKNVSHFVLKLEYVIGKFGPDVKSYLTGQFSCKFAALVKLFTVTFYELMDLLRRVMVAHISDQSKK